MRKTKRMLIPAGIAIMIGTAFIASTFLFGNAMNDSLRLDLFLRVFQLGFLFLWRQAVHKFW